MLSPTRSLLLASLACGALLSAPQQMLAQETVPNVTVNLTQKQKAAQAFLGHGYHLEQTFASGDSCGPAIFDTTNSANYDLSGVPEFSESIYSGSSVSSYMNQFNTKAGAQFPVYGAAVELKASFGAKIERLHTNRFTTVMQNLAYARATLKTGVKPITAVQTEIDSVTTSAAAQALFQKYGTHYTKSLRLGASLSMSTMVDKTKATNEIDASVAVKATIKKKKTGGNVQVDNKYKDLMSLMESNSTIRAIGGNPALAANLKTATGSLADAYTNWSKTISQFLNLAGLYVPTDLDLIANLATSPTTKQLLTTEAAKYLALFEINDGFSLVLQNSEFILEHKTGKYITKNYSGKSYYYPLVGVGKSSAEPYQLQGDSTAVQKSGKVVRIKTSNTGGWNSGWGNYNFLGTFNDGVYYWNDSQPAKLNWYFELVGRSGQHSIFFGDQVRLKNESYNQYLYPGASNPSTQSTADDTTIWVIRPKT